MKIVLFGMLGLLGIIGGWVTEMSTVSTGYPVQMESDTLKTDPESGLIISEHLPMVVAQCATVCHSSQLIRANRFTRDGWQQKIRWMQANHNLWELGDTEKIVLDYLETYYSPTKGVARRKPLQNIEWYRLENN
jgi:hypothetical protein